jgi:hypothetical protein
MGSSKLHNPVRAGEVVAYVARDVIWRGMNDVMNAAAG